MDPAHAVTPETTRISVVGLGKLGAPLAACFAWKGFPTLGLDIDPQKVLALNQGLAPVHEPGLQDLLTATRGRLAATGDYERLVLESEITFVIVPTPSGADGSFSLQHVLEAMRQIGRILKTTSKHHLVVLTSTVMPGSIERTVKPLLEQHAGTSCGHGLGLCYSPEFVALGNVIHDFLNPDLLLIGESDPSAGDLLARVYHRVCENTPPVARMNFVNAELTKLALNTYVTTKITFANTLARICERLSGADVDIVTAALGLDRRIGNRYLRGAIGYGGPCFPRDNLALAGLARSLGVSANVAEATDAFNRRQVQWLSALVKDQTPPKGTVGILGLAYKADSDVVEESQGFLLAQRLAEDGVRVVTYDPAAMENARRRLGDGVGFAASARDCVRDADVVVVTTPWDQFTQLTRAELARPQRPRVLVDCWRMFTALGDADGIMYMPLGRGVHMLADIPEDL